MEEFYSFSHYFHQKLAYIKKKQYFCTRFSEIRTSRAPENSTFWKRREREGELTEWSKVPHSKCGVRITSYRGFESLTLRRVNEKDVHKRASFFIYLESEGLLHPRSVGSYLASLERLMLRIFRIPVGAFSAPDRWVLISLRSND